MKSRFLSTLAPIALAASLSFAVPAAFAKSPAEWQAIASKATVSLDQAIAKAAEAGKGTVIDIELDDGDGAGPRFESKVATPAGETLEIWVNAATGEATLHKQKGKTDSKDAKRIKDAKITVAQAVESALKATPGTPIAAELDSDWGKTSYQVEVLQQDGTVKKVKIDAADGSHTRSKKAN